jgi:hypothetical protein
VSRRLASAGLSLAAAASLNGRRKSKGTVMSKLIVAAGVALVCVGWMKVVRGDEVEQAEPVNKFMRAKLRHCQKVLEGLTTEDYDAIARHGQAMSLLSQEAGWRVLQTPGYIRRSTAFRRSSEALIDSAREKNLDGATLKFVDVTIKCVECHKYVRRIQHARIGKGNILLFASAFEKGDGLP